MIKEGKALARKHLAKEMGCSLEELDIDDEDLGFPLQSSEKEHATEAKASDNGPPEKKCVSMA